MRQVLRGARPTTQEALQDWNEAWSPPNSNELVEVASGHFLEISTEYELEQGGTRVINEWRFFAIDSAGWYNTKCISDGPGPRIVPITNQ